MIVLVGLSIVDAASIINKTMFHVQLGFFKPCAVGVTAYDVYNVG